MPKQPTKKSPSRKPSVKASMKAQPKKQPKKHAKPTPPTKGFMWKLLEQKQTELKRTETHPKHPYAHADLKPSDNHGRGMQGYTRFNGPRRKAA